MSFLSSLPGVVDAAGVLREDVPEFLAAEEANLQGQLVPVKYVGIHAVTQREEIVVILKDSTFRPPPSPTLLLVEEAKPADATTGEFLTLAGTTYHVIGEEVMTKEPDYEEKHIFFDKGFVLFPERREKHQHVPSFFILPPIPFPELHREKTAFHMRDIVSVSPSSRGDDYLRTVYSFSKAPEYATILIGWNRVKSRTEYTID